MEYKSEFKEIPGKNPVYQIKIDIPWSMKFVHIYILKLDENYVMIDAGFSPESWKKVLYDSMKKNIGITIQDIDSVIVTHEHTDHIGQILAFKKDNPDIQIMFHEYVYEIAKLNQNEEKFRSFEEKARELASQIVRYGLSEREGQFLAGMYSSRPMRIDYLEPDKKLKDNDEIVFNSNKLKIIWVPGHAIGEICIWDEKNRYLFSGDHILSRITPHIGLFAIPDIDFDFHDILDHYLKSLDRIDSLNPKIIFPGHQEIIYNPHERITEIKNHHQNRLFEISKAILNKPLTPYQISRIHFGEDLDELNSLLALSEVLGHLIYLEEKEKAFRKEKDGKMYFWVDKVYEKVKFD